MRVSTRDLTLAGLAQGLTPAGYCRRGVPAIYFGDAAMEKPMSTSKIPQTDSIEELARFWDQHDLTDFEDELEEVPEPIFEREAVVKVPLPFTEAETLKQLAESKGVRDVD